MDKVIFKELCNTLNGWNYEENSEGSYFDFYSKDGKAILTLKLDHNNNISLADNVEYYYGECTYKNLSLKQYSEELSK